LPDALTALERPASGEPQGALVLLHGRGADEHDLFPLLDALDPERRLHGYTPRAPLSLPPGGAHWYHVPRVGYPDPETFALGYAALTGWFDALPFPADRVVLGGFSQGTVMSYAMSLGPGRPRPAGLVAMSGFLPRVADWPLEPERLRGVPVGIAHGSLDPVIPAQFAAEAEATLTAAGADVLRLSTPVPHMVDPDWIEPLRDLVARATAA